MRKKLYLALVGLLLVTLNFTISHESHASAKLLIKILNPGEGSKVTAPIEVIANLALDDGDFIRLSLIDDNQITYTRKLHGTEEMDELNFEYRTSLAFEIPKDSTQALLSLAIRDRYNRYRSIRSVPLTLLKEGITEIEDQPTKESWLVISAPEPDERLDGGKVFVKGQIRPLTERPIFFDLVTESGRVIGTAQLAVKIPFEDMEFEISIPFTITKEHNNVLLTIRQMSAEYGVNLILDSIPIILLP